MLGISQELVGTSENHQFQHVRFRTGQHVFTAGQAFEMLYIVNAGFLKTVLIDESGHAQVLSFLMKGDLFGIDGIHERKYVSEAVALSDCDIILVPFKTLSVLGRANPELELAIYGAMSRELIREREMVGMIGSLSAEARVARFLVWLSARYAQLGYSPRQFELRMSRNDIGSYLGMALETVSRTLSAFADMGLISVDLRTIVIHDLQALKTLRRLPASHSRSRRKERAVA